MNVSVKYITVDFNYVQVKALHNCNEEPELIHVALQYGQNDVVDLQFNKTYNVYHIPLEHIRPGNYTLWFTYIVGNKKKFASLNYEKKLPKFN